MFEIYLLPVAFYIWKKQTETGGETAVLAFQLEGGNTVNIYLGKEGLKTLKDEIEKFFQPRRDEATHEEGSI
jgi:hypothetical protein